MTVKAALSPCRWCSLRPSLVMSLNTVKYVHNGGRWRRRTCSRLLHNILRSSIIHWFRLELVVEILEIINVTLSIGQTFLVVWIVTDTQCSSHNSVRFQSHQCWVVDSTRCTSPASYFSKSWLMLDKPPFSKLFPQGIQTLAAVIHFSSPPLISTRLWNDYIKNSCMQFYHVGLRFQWRSPNSFMSS